MKIRAIIDDVGGYRISLSTDRTRNLNFITGGNGVGKTRMFGKIKARFQNEETENGIDLDLTEECGLDADLMFVSDIWRMRDALFRSREFPRGQLREIVQSANRMLSTVGGVFESEDSLLKSSDGRILAPRGLAAGPSAVSTLAALASVKKHTMPGLPVLIDDSLWQTPRFALRTLEMLARNVNQVLIFGQNHEFGYGCFDSIPPDAPSLHRT